MSTDNPKAGNREHKQVERAENCRNHPLTAAVTGDPCLDFNLFAYSVNVHRPPFIGHRGPGGDR